MHYTIYFLIYRDTTSSHYGTNTISGLFDYATKISECSKLKSVRKLSLKIVMQNHHMDNMSNLLQCNGICAVGSRLCIFRAEANTLSLSKCLV